VVVETESAAVVTVDTLDGSKGNTVLEPSKHRPAGLALNAWDALDGVGEEHSLIGTLDVGVDEELTVLWRGCSSS
jgi:hypothetical protein